MSRWALVVAAAVGALLWLGAPAWPQQVDDQFITLAFAHEWAATGLLRWSGGAVVEACSSFLQLSLAAAWIALGGADANLFVKVLGALCGLGVLVFTGARLAPSLGGALLLAALVVWEPLAWWSFAGMETTLYALLLTLGWVGVLAPPTGARPRLGPAAGLGALWLAATAHPEGNLHFALGAAIVLLRWRSPGAGRDRRAALLAGGALILWHALRVAYFGALLPTPYLVKMAGNDAFGDQWAQWAWEMVTLVGVGGVLALAFPARPLALLPLLVQCAFTLRAEPDWMGHARHLVPGVCATAAAWAAGARPRALSGWRALALLGAIGLGGLFEPPSATHTGLERRDLAALTAPLRAFGAALDTPQLEDVEWIVESTPWGGSVLLEDVGMPGNIDGVVIVDLVGLTDRDIARAWLGDDEVDARVRARFAAAPPALVRRMNYEVDAAARPVPWLRLPSPSRVLYPQGTALRYRLDPARPTPEQVVARWSALHARYPSQGPLAWSLALAESRRGQLLAAVRVATAAGRRYPDDPVLQSLPGALFAPVTLASFDAAPAATARTSREIPRADAASLSLLLAVDPPADDGQLVTLRWGCDGPPQTVVVRDTTRVPLPAWACPGDTARLRVEVLDRRPNRPLARVLDAGLTLRE